MYDVMYDVINKTRDVAKVPPIYYLLKALAPPSV